MSLCSKTHATLFPRCYAHGGFNNRIPTTISQACYRNPHAVMSGFFLYSSFACFTRQEPRVWWKTSAVSPTRVQRTMLYVFHGNLRGRSRLVIPTCSRNMAACNLGFNVTMRRSRTGIILQGEQCAKCAFRIPISAHNRRTVMPIWFASYMLHIRMLEDYTCARGLVRIRHKRYTYICIYLRALQDIRSASGENFIKEADARFFSLSNSFRGRYRLS